MVGRTPSKDIHLRVIYERADSGSKRPASASASLLAYRGGTHRRHTEHVVSHEFGLDPASQYVSEYDAQRRTRTIKIETVWQCMTIAPHLAALFHLRVPASINYGALVEL